MITIGKMTLSLLRRGGCNNRENVKWNQLTSMILCTTAVKKTLIFQHLKHKRKGMLRSNMERLRSRQLLKEVQFCCKTHPKENGVKYQFK